MTRRRSAFLGATTLAAVIGSVLTVAPGPAMAAEGDSWIEGERYYEILFDRGVSWLDGEIQVAATCPTSHKYLDAKSGTPDRDAGQGLVITQEHEDFWINELSHRRSYTWLWDSTRVASGTVLSFSTWNPFYNAGLQVKMVCTKNADDGWKP
jgi:hypothetical protein